MRVPNKRPGAEYKFNSLIISDDLRKEDNGKEIIIGVYTGSVVVESVPILLPTFVLRFDVRVHKIKFDKISVVLKDPSNSDVARIQATTEARENNINVIIPIKISPLVLPQFGTYGVYLGMDSKEKLVSTFEVIARPDPQMS